MKKLHNIMIAALSLLATASVAFGVHNLTVANAATLPSMGSFQMENGAAARIKTLTDAEGNAVESNGLRFSAEINETEYTTLAEAGARFGVVIVAKDLAKTVEINEETVFGANPSFYFSNETQTANGKISMLHIANAACGNIDEDANVEICGSIVNLAVSNFTRSFIGRAYVALPQTDESGTVTGYTYQFAPYYEGKVENNTRCMYFIAQRAVEDKIADASLLQEKYLDEFAKTDRFTKYTYRYTVLHHYIQYEDDGTETILYTDTQPLYAQLNSTVSGYPIEKPKGEVLDGINFIFDVTKSKATQSGLVYAAGMQTLHMYYVKGSDISEENKADTLKMLLIEFLSTAEEDVYKNFDVDTTAGGSWTAESITGADNMPTGINLVTKNPSKDQAVTLSKVFFANLYAYGVETVSFSFYAKKNGQYVSAYNMYKGDTDIDMPFIESPTDTEEYRVTIKIADLMDENGIVQYGVRLEIENNASSNVGDYIFENVTFGFLEDTTAV